RARLHKTMEATRKKAHDDVARVDEKETTPTGSVPEVDELENLVSEWEQEVRRPRRDDSMKMQRSDSLQMENELRNLLKDQDNKIRRLEIANQDLTMEVKTQRTGNADLRRANEELRYMQDQGIAELISQLKGLKMEVKMQRNGGEELRRGNDELRFLLEERDKKYKRALMMV
ncbi:hypothetical protein PFISCL1PPCAC_11188, partial [Pristionchus fissidentatus]